MDFPRLGEDNEGTHTIHKHVERKLPDGRWWVRQSFMTVGSQGIQLALQQASSRAPCAWWRTGEWRRAHVRASVLCGIYPVIPRTHLLEHASLDRHICVQRELVVYEGTSQR